MYKCFAYIAIRLHGLDIQIDIIDLHKDDTVLHTHIIYFVVSNIRKFTKVAKTFHMVGHVNEKEK